MSSVVVGLDIGSHSTCIAIYTKNGLEVVPNKFSHNTSHTFVTLGAQKRLFGDDSKQSHMSNLSNTIYNIKSLIGCFDKPTFADQLLYETDVSDNSLHVRVTNGDNAICLRPEEILSMYISDVVNTIEAMGYLINGCVISAAVNFSISARKCLLDALEIVGLRCFGVINDSLAAAITRNYFHFSSDFYNAIIIDVGHNICQFTYVHFESLAVKVLYSSAINTLCGRELTHSIFELMCSSCIERFNINPRSSKKLTLKFMNAAEKLKILLSSSKQSLPVTIECIGPDVDFNFYLCQESFENSLVEVQNKFRQALIDFLGASNALQLGIRCVELIGGSCRIPFVQNIVKEIISMSPSFTLNADESVAKGCALTAVWISGSFPLKPWLLEDTLCMPVCIKSNFDDIILFPVSSKIPSRICIVLHESSEFYIYHGSELFCKIELETDGNSDCAIQISAALSIDSLLTIEEITSVCADESYISKFQSTPLKGNPCKYIINFAYPFLTSEQLAQAKVNESNWLIKDIDERNKENALNALESFVFECKHQMGEMRFYLTDDERNDFETAITEEESWLDDATSNDNCALRHKRLRSVIDPLLSRKRAHEEVKSSMSDFEIYLKKLKRTSNEMHERNGLSHVDLREFNSIITESLRWYQSSLECLKNCTRLNPPPFTAHYVQDRMSNIAKQCDPIIAKHLNSQKRSKWAFWRK